MRLPFLKPVLRFRLSVAFTLLWAGVTNGQEIAGLFEPFDVPWLTLDDRGESESEEEHLETDRDSFTPATSTVGTGRVLFESAYTFAENHRTENTHSFPEIVTRIGINEHTELRLGWSHEVADGGSPSNGDLLYGVKIAMTMQNAWIPQSACIIQGTTPTSGLETFSDFQLGYVFGWEIFEKWQLDSSIRYFSTKEDDDQFNNWDPSVVLKVPVGERWSVHGEYFGIFSDGRAENQTLQYFSPGVHYLVSPDFEVGVRAGWGLTQDSADSFINVGFGLRF